MNEEKEKRLIPPSKLFFYGISLLAFYLVIRYMGKLEDIKTLLAQVNPFWIIIILCFQGATYMLYALILQVLLRSRSGARQVGILTLLKMSVVLLFVNQTLPSGGISGNGYILGQLVKRKVSGIWAFKTLVMESVSYYIAFLAGLILIYTLFTCCQYSHTIKSPVILYTTLTGIIFFLGLGGIMLLLNNKRMLSFIARKLSRFSFFRKCLKKISLPVPGAQFAADTEQAKISAAAFFKAVLLQLGLIACDILTVSCLLYAFHIPLPFLLLVLAVLLSAVIGALPISPGSLIVFESAMTYFLTLVGVPVHAAMIVTLLYRFFTFWLPIPVGLLLYRKLRKEQVAV